VREEKMSIGMARILGIPIKIHYTLILAFILIAGTLAVGFMPNEYPGLSGAIYLLMGVLGAITLFASVLIHEIAHSYIAIRNGLKVERIVLFIFGGVSEMTEEPKDPKVEFRLALAGPLTSFALAIILWILWQFILIIRGSVILAAAFEYGGFINILLGIFNLIPAFPMDGGRVLRATIWSRNNNLFKATRTASRVGTAFAYLFMGTGLFSIFWGDLISGLWFVFIGWFLKNAAESSLVQTTISEALEAISIRDLMTTTVHTVSPDLSLKNAVQDYFLVYKHGGFPVVEEDRILGIITLGDIKSVSKDSWEEIRCRDVMTPVERLISVTPQQSASEALLLMSKHNVGRLLVLEDGKLAGIISRSDLLKTIQIKTELAAL
jgi:Zn-dependent protease/predicted transcriptional regulator